MAFSLIIFLPFKGRGGDIGLVLCSSLPFKGRAGVGMGLRPPTTITCFWPIPLLASPLKGEEENHLLRYAGVCGDLRNAVFHILT
jgi:hypothetical protein